MIGRVINFIPRIAFFIVAQCLQTDKDEYENGDDNIEIDSYFGLI